MNPNAIPAASSRAAFDQAPSHKINTAAANASPLSTAARAGDAHVEQAIANASRQTGIDFDYLVAQAQVESAMDPAARASTSSATGLYQFIESTWLHTMQRHGPRFGFGEAAGQIGTLAGGALHIGDPAQRKAILDLRKDPRVASLMAAALAEDNSAHLAPILGRQPEAPELYLAHFLGRDGAGRFLRAMAQDPSQPAAALFARPAAANNSVFYDRGGAARSLSGVMEHLATRLARAGATPIPAAMPAFASAQEGAGASSSATSPLMPAPTTSYRGTSAPQRLPALAALPAAGAPTPQPMSRLLAGAFADAGEFASPRASQQVRRAYDQLRAFGL